MSGVLSRWRAASAVRHADSLFAARQLDSAAAEYRRALSCLNSYAPAHKGLGLVLVKQGQPAEGLRYLRDCIELGQPADGRMHFGMGCALDDLGKIDEALAAFTEASLLDAGNAEIWNNLGSCHERLHDDMAAETCYRRAIACLNPPVAPFRNVLALLLRQLRIKDVEQLARETLAAYPQSPDLAELVADYLAASGQSDGAVASYIAALERAPGRRFLYSKIGRLLQSSHRFEEALPWLEEALEFDENDLSAVIDLGNCCRALGLHERNREMLARAWSIDPTHPVVLVNEGFRHDANGRLREAIELFDKALETQPESIEAHLNRSLAYLSAGDYVRGFAEYEIRLTMPLLKPVVASLVGSRWQGEPLQGEKVLLVMEQGYGDAIQFARYIPLVRARGGLPVVDAFPEMRRLFSIGCGVQVLGDDIAEAPKAEYSCPLMSLAYVFATEVSSIPVDLPYIKMPEETRLPWRQKLASGPPACLRVGIVWQSGAHNPVSRFKSVPCELLAPLAKIENVEWISLQVKHSDSERHMLEAFSWRDVSGDMHDFFDTAALVSELDLVISVDTAVGHLAGALGIPVWLMLVQYPDWRWRLGETETPWYPGMRLFKQAETGQWESVIANVQAAVCALANK